MATDKIFHETFLNKINSSKNQNEKYDGEYLVYYDGKVIGGL